MASTYVLGAKYRWKMPADDLWPQVSALAGQYHIMHPVMHILVSRGYGDPEKLQQFIFTPKNELVHQAALLKDAQRVVDRILHAIKQQEKILIVGDYDVDGITATSLLLCCLSELGARVNFFLPNRMRDGYGISVTTVDRAAKSGYGVIITVDNGITAFEPAAAARAHGVDMIITDHHRPHDHVPDAYAIVNPCQRDCAYPHKCLAGVGVAFKVAQLLFDALGKQLPEKVYELLLFGTVADVVPLVDENRYWVRYGLQTVNASPSVAVQVLKNNARLTNALSSLDIGFSLAPQLNALGRLEDPRDGVKFLLGDDVRETERIGGVLHQLNQVRRTVEKSVVADIEMDIERGLFDVSHDMVIVASRTGWPVGVIGLAASRLVGSYGRPVFLFHQSASGLLKGSCRSIPAINVFELLTDVKDLLVNFGGHAAAAGLSIERDALPEFKRRAHEYVQARLSMADLQQEIVCEAVLTLPEVSKKLVRDLLYLEPFGAENQRPTFIVRGVTLLEEPTLLKEAHVRCMIFSEGIIKPVIFFNRPDLYSVLCGAINSTIDVAVNVAENVWEGTTRVEFHGVDVAVRR